MLPASCSLTFLLAVCLWIALLQLCPYHRHPCQAALSLPAACLLCSCAGASGVKPWDALDLLQHEILEYSDRLDALPALVVANKIDLLPRPASVLKLLGQRTDLRVVGVSAKSNMGIGELLEALGQLVEGGAGMRSF
jgi:GTPase involved in cell partitioning and DNA repair